MGSISSKSPDTLDDDALLPSEVRRDRAARALVAALERFVAECVPTAPKETEWVDQNESPLGRRRHLAAIRRGHLTGRKLGKRVLVRRADLNSYLEKQTVVVGPNADAASVEAGPRHAVDVAAAVLTSVGFVSRKGK